MGLCLLAVLLPLGSVVSAGRGSQRCDWSAEPGFPPGYPSRHADQAGILPALVGSSLLVLWTALFALPTGVGAAIYLEEYGRGGRMRA
jgi:phosphate transport system permease protein